MSGLDCPHPPGPKRLIGQHNATKLVKIRSNNREEGMLILYQPTWNTKRQLQTDLQKNKEQHYAPGQWIAC